MPSPGEVTFLDVPGGPGVRVDSGVRAGDVVSGAFDSLLAKLIVTGSSREDALERSRRALDEFEVQGLPTVLPFHRAIVRDAAFAPADGAPFSVYTRWIESEFDNQIAPWSGEPGTAEPGERESGPVRPGEAPVLVVPGPRTGGERPGRARLPVVHVVAYDRDGDRTVISPS